MYGMGDVIDELREEIKVLRAENAELRAKLGLDLPISKNTKICCPACKQLGDLSSHEDWFLRNCKVDGDKLTADLTCMNCKQFSMPWEGNLAAGESAMRERHFASIDIENSNCDVSFQEGEYEVDVVSFFFRDPEGALEESISLELMDKRYNGLHISLTRNLAKRICNALQKHLAAEER